MNSTVKPLVSLRAIEPEDLDILYDIENDKELWNVGCTNVPYSRFTLHNYIADCANDIYTDKQLRLMIVNQEGEVVGIVDLVNFDPRHQRAEIGIVIMRKFRRRGYASAAVSRLMGYARNNLHIHQLYVFVNINNIGSKNLFSSLGFHESMPLKDWLFENGKYQDALLMQHIL